MADFDPKELGAYIDAGYQLIPLHRWDRISKHKSGKPRQDGKRPVDNDWTTKDYSAFDPEAHTRGGKNVGVRLTAEQLVVDVDPRNMPDGRNTFAELCDAVGLDRDAYPTVETGSGGLHLYMTKPADVSVVDSLKGYKGVEFKTRGRQVVAAGSVHPNGKRYEWDFLGPNLAGTPAAPAALLDAIGRTATSTSDTSGVAEAGAYEAEELATMLERLEPDDFRDHGDWLTLMMACHHATDGSGREEFVAWSTGDPLYADSGGEVEYRWDSLSAEPPGGVAVTHGTLHKLLVDAGAGDAIPRPTPEEDFPDDLTEDFLEGLGAGRKGGSFERLLSQWVFVADALKFVRRSDLKKFKPEQWNSLYASLKPDVNLVNRVYKGQTPVRRFESLVFIPGQPEELSGSRYNIWRPSGVEARQGNTSVLDEHLELLLPDEAERGHLLDYMHFLVARPETKMMFALLLQGAQGTGKSALGALLRRTIGGRNVVLPSNEEVNGRWTAWQEGAQLAIIEELMTSGRMELANRLKPVITDPTLRIEDKHQPLYSIPNYLNLLCFTNHRDAVRLEGGDRRWLVLFSPMEPQNDAYYDRLFQWIHSVEGPAAFRHMMEQRRPALRPKGRAPHTEAKEEMRSASLTQVESEVLEWAEGECGPFRNDLFRFRDAVDSLSPSAARSARGLNAALSRGLRGAGAIRHTRNTNSADGLPKVQLWSIRDHERWERAGPVGRVRAYLEMRSMTAEDFNETEG